MDERIFRPELAGQCPDALRHTAKQPTGCGTYRSLFQSRLYNVAQIALAMLVTEQSFTTSTDTGVRDSTRQGRLTDSTEGGSGGRRFFDRPRSYGGDTSTRSCDGRIARYSPQSRRCTKEVGVLAGISTTSRVGVNVVLCSLVRCCVRDRSNEIPQSDVDRRFTCAWSLQASGDRLDRSLQFGVACDLDIRVDP